MHTVDLTAELRSERAVAWSSGERKSVPPRNCQGKSGGYGFAASLPLGDIAAGTYIIHVEARSNIDDRPVVSRDI